MTRNFTPRRSPVSHHQLIAMDDLDDMRDTTDSDDDLNITQSVQKDLGHEDYIKSAPLTSFISQTVD